MKRKKERGVSNAEFYEQIKKDVIESEQVVVIAQLPDGRIETHFTADEQTSLLGMMEISKVMIVDDMTVYE